MTKGHTHVDNITTGPFLPREMHELIFRAFEDADGALTKVGGDVVDVVSLISYVHLPGLKV